MELDRPIDITAEQHKAVLALLASHLPNTAAWVYGSRVKWTARPESDLDLVVFARPEQSGHVSDLREAFEESNLPFRVDLFVWDDVPEQFRKTIESEHVVLVESEELGVGADDWTRYTVDELKSSAPNALATGPFGSAISSRHFIDDGIPVIRGSNLSQDIGTRLDDHGLVFVSESKAKEFSRSLAKPGDLIFTCWGTIDQVGLIDDRSQFQDYVVSNKQMKLTPDPQKSSSLFLYYLFSSPLMRDQILNQAIGSSVPGFNLGQLRSMKLALPPLPEQRSIAHVLGTLDDKIELNRQMNQTLEEMARALYKSWFVDFDPVCANATLKHHAIPPQGGSDWSVERAGAYLDTIDPNITPLFPDSFVDSELGPIPKGWQVKELGEFVELAYGKALKAENRRSGKIPVYGSNGQVGWHAKELVVGPGIVVGRKGNPGAVKWVQSDFFPIDTTFYVIPRNPIFRLTFLFFALTHQDLKSVAADSVVPGLNRNLAYMNRQVAPPERVVEKFDDCASAIFTRAHRLQAQSRKLEALRDTLLPKLISGELRVKDVESFFAKIVSP